MTNFEFFKDEMIEIRKAANNISVEKNEPVECKPHNCYNCDLYDGEGKESCLTQFINWLFQEHKEKPKLTKRERAMCEILEYGWIAADIDGTVYWYEILPHQYSTYYDCAGNNTGLSQIGLKFNFITFHTGPWKVVDLLQLEVEE